jgi:hypothetical protein
MKDSLCIFRAYIGYTSCALVNFSFLIQAVCRYLIIVYPTRLFYQTVKFQILIIFLTYIYIVLYIHLHLHSIVKLFTILTIKYVNHLFDFLSQLFI